MPSSILSDKRIRLFFGVWWIVCLLLDYLLLKDINADNKHAEIDALISISLLAICCFFISNNMRYYLPRQEKYWYILFTSLAVSGCWILLQRGALWAIFPASDHYSTLIQSTWKIRFGAGFLLTSSVSMFSLLWYSQQEQKKQQERKNEIEILSRDAELYKLRQQLQPHFLFNSLNSISALTSSQPEKARHMIQQLSDFLRGTINKEEQVWNTLQEEVQYLELYLDIEKVRFGFRLQTDLQLDEKAMPLKLPALLLQPVVENAIKFGLYDTTGEVLIRLHATSENNYLKIVIQNPYDPESAPPLKGTGYGLSSIARRLFLLFARHDLLKTDTRHEQYITTIWIPQIV